MSEVKKMKFLAAANGLKQKQARTHPFIIQVPER